MGYLANFMVYTLAMVGVIAIALLVFKNSTSFGVSSKSKCLKVLDTLSLAPRKTLYIVSAGNEKFLVAGDVNQTTLISKLETSKAENSKMEVDNLQATPEISFKETMAKLPKSNYIDRSSVGIKSSILSEKSNQTAYKSVIKSLAAKMQ